jgi:16S rRNA (uracil1498-N3)-methyltransferase
VQPVSLKELLPLEITWSHSGGWSMNSLIIFEDEGWNTGMVTLRDTRAQSVFHGSDFVVGQEIAVALFGGEKARAQVLRCETDCVELALHARQPSQKLRPIDLVVGLSRPQTTKKVIQAAVMAGVRSLHLVHTQSGEKSYLDSHLLRPECLRAEVVKSLEQTGEGLFPAIHVHRSFARVSNDVLDTLGSTGPHLRLVAAPGEPLISSPTLKQECDALVIAVGSEAGWSERELSRLKEKGFIGVGLGSRVLRVEVALLFLLGQSLFVPFAGDITS